MDLDLIVPLLQQRMWFLFTLWFHTSFFYTFSDPENIYGRKIITAPQQYLWEGNVFTGMCHSFCPRGCTPACNGAGGVYPSMQWGSGCVSQHEMGQGVYNPVCNQAGVVGVWKGVVKGVGVVNFWYNFLLWPSGVAFWCGLMSYTPLDIECFLVEQYIITSSEKEIVIIVSSDCLHKCLDCLHKCLEYGNQQWHRQWCLYVVFTTYSEIIPIKITSTYVVLSCQSFGAIIVAVNCDSLSLLNF